MTGKEAPKAPVLSDASVAVFLDASSLARENRMLREIVERVPEAKRLLLQKLSVEVPNGR